MPSCLARTPRICEQSRVRVKDGPRHRCRTRAQAPGEILDHTGRLHYSRAQYSTVHRTWTLTLTLPQSPQEVKKEDPVCPHERQVPLCSLSLGRTSRRRTPPKSNTKIFAKADSDVRRRLHHDEGKSIFRADNGRFLLHHAASSSPLPLASHLSIQL
jgi:hypothetical protein